MPAGIEERLCSTAQEHGSALRPMGVPRTGGQLPNFSAKSKTAQSNVTSPDMRCKLWSPGLGFNINAVYSLIKVLWVSKQSNGVDHTAATAV